MFFFFFTDSATTAIYTLSLHDALPISAKAAESSTGRLLTAAFHHLGSFGFAAGGCSRCLGVRRSGGTGAQVPDNAVHPGIFRAVQFTNYFAVFVTDGDAHSVLLFRLGLQEILNDCSARRIGAHEQLLAVEAAAPVRDSP